MKIKISVLTLFIAVTLFSACASGSKIGGTNKSCGCGAKKGMVGY